MKRTLCPVKLKDIVGHNTFIRYAGIEQRRLVVESESRRQADLCKWLQKLDKAEEEANKKRRDLCQPKFTCQPDALGAAKRLSQKLPYHNFTNIQARELEPEAPQKASAKIEELRGITYQVQAGLEPDTDKIEGETRSAGRFVLATNVLDVNELSNDEILLFV